MYKGVPVKGIEFYNLLFESEEFTSELGKVELASGKLEAGLLLLLKRNGIDKTNKKVTLGGLIKAAKEINVLDNNLIIALKGISDQRNYLTHNIYALFTGVIEETILGKNGLLDSDVEVFVEMAWQLKENLNGLAENIMVSLK